MARMPPDERRSAIVDATVVVMTRKGMAATTVRDVADQMGTSSGLIHHYFDSMDDLLAAGFDRAASQDLDVHLPCDVQIIWSETQERVALLLNGRPHAVFDFVAKRGYCRSNFPAASSWSKDGHGWEDEAVQFLNAGA